MGHDDPTDKITDETSDDPFEQDESRNVVTPEPPDLEAAEYQTLANGVLNPRHRKFCQLAAEGRTNKEIGEELGYVPSRISVLHRNPYIVAEIKRLQDRIFEETIQTRMKSFSESALNNIHKILNDNTNRVKVSEKMALSQWVIEKLDGKATQKTDIGENLLSVIMDRLDARSVASQTPIQRQTIDVTPLPQIEGAPEAPKSDEQSDELAKWIKEFASTSGVE